MSQTASGALKGVGRRGAQWTRTRAVEGAEATRETARGSLQDSARALADQRYREARQHARGLRGPKPPAPAPPRSGHRAPQQRARRNVGLERARRRPRALRGGQGACGAGRSQSAPQRAALESSAICSASPPRIAPCSSAPTIPPITPTAPAMTAPSSKQLRGPERERAQEAIEKATKARPPAPRGRLLTTRADRRARPPGSRGIAPARRGRGAAAPRAAAAPTAPAPLRDSSGAAAQPLARGLTGGRCAASAPRPLPRRLRGAPRGGAPLALRGGQPIPPPAAADRRPGNAGEPGGRGSQSARDSECGSCAGR